MGELRNVLLLIRRGAGHAFELWGLTQATSSCGFWILLNHEIEHNLGVFVLIVVAINAVYELLQISLRPDLRESCKDKDQMLDLDGDK